MEAAGYSGIAFMPRGKAILFLTNGRSITITAAQAERLVRARAEEGLPPIPVVEPSDVPAGEAAPVQSSGRTSWGARIGSGATLLHRALFIRTSCNLPVPPHPASPPRLIGGVADHSAELRVTLLADAGSEWLSWWHDVVQFQVRVNLPEAVPPLEGRERMRARHGDYKALFDWPELSALESKPALRRAAQVSLDDARRFRNVAKLAVVQRLEDGGPPRPIACEPRSIAESLIERLAISPDRLHATIEVLGVAGDWSYQPAPGVLFCSMAIAQDARRIAPLVEAAFLSGIDAA